MNKITCFPITKGLYSGYIKKINSDIMQFSKIPGRRNEHKVILFALSTCGWCKLVKQFLIENEVEYDYIDIDLSEENEKEEIRQIIRDRGGPVSFPTTIIDNKILITGFRKDKIKEVLNF